MILYYILVPLAWLVFHIGFRVRCEGRENLKKIGTKAASLPPTISQPSTRCSSSSPDSGASG